MGFRGVRLLQQPGVPLTHFWLALSFDEPSFFVLGDFHFHNSILLFLLGQHGVVELAQEYADAIDKIPAADMLKVVPKSMAESIGRLNSLTSKCRIIIGAWLEQHGYMPEMDRRAFAKKIRRGKKNS